MTARSITRHYSWGRPRPLFVVARTGRGATVSTFLDTFRGSRGIPVGPRAFSLLVLVGAVSDCARRWSPPGGRAVSASPPRRVFAPWSVAPPAKEPTKSENLSSLPPPPPPRCIGQVRPRVQRGHSARCPSGQEHRRHGGSSRTRAIRASVLSVVVTLAITASTARWAACPRRTNSRTSSADAPTAGIILAPPPGSRVI
jgi:hypothetical protein